jgi:GTP-binding protein EngB required for normal cell division
MSCAAAARPPPLTRWSPVRALSRQAQAGDPRLAIVSSRPGRTRSSNRFLINGAYVLVDLPGYGYAASAGRGERDRWHAATRDFLTSRPTVAAALLLVDASLPPKALDVDGARWLALEVQARVVERRERRAWREDI